MKTYYPIIGLEVHAELKTKSKMFCACKNDADEVSPNKNVCPICMAHPGTLPVPNRAAIESVIRVGLALDATIADFTEFDRKNYFYPDIPKGYQISQYKYPIVSGGNLRGVQITRVHLEEDTGTSKHDRGNFTLVDYNRAGVPLMELVTEPVMHSAKEAGDFARELQLLLRYLDVSEANMEKGEMRVEVNISVSDNPEQWGTKVEVKNINSFRSVERTIEHEVERMIALYEAGRADEIVQETRGWDETKQVTYSQRSKENAQDYRYFPDPDLPKMKLHSAFTIDGLKASLPELPWQKRERYLREYGLKADDVEVYINDSVLSEYFETVSSKLQNVTQRQTASNYIISDLLGGMKKDASLTFPKAEYFAELIGMVSEGVVTSRGAKDILVMIFKEHKAPSALAKEHGLLQENNEEALLPIIETVIAEHEKIALDYTGGKETALQALVGMVMKASKGSANPALAAKLLKEKLGK
jgi:aspartyl-tRNA(Asn)/glutamyl-tRNA(Gln) amidotransferase subunit B